MTGFNFEFVRMKMKPIDGYSLHNGQKRPMVLVFFGLLIRDDRDTTQAIGYRHTQLTSIFINQPETKTYNT